MQPCRKDGRGGRAEEINRRASQGTGRQSLGNEGNISKIPYEKKKKPGKINPYNETASELEAEVS